MKRHHDTSHTKCICGHLFAHHVTHNGRPMPCRLCECEDAMTKTELRELQAACGIEEQPE